LAKFFYIAGKKDSETLLEYSTINIPDDKYNDFVTSIATNHNISAANLSVWQETNLNDTGIKQIMSGADFSIIWSSNEITGYDLSLEENKPWLEFFNISGTDKIEAGSNDTILINCNILTPDKSNVDESFNGYIDVPINTPSKPAFMRFTFINGKSSQLIRQSSSGTWGEWQIPNTNRFETYRVSNQIKLNSIIIDITKLQ